MDKTALRSAGSSVGRWTRAGGAGLLALSCLGCATQLGRSVQQPLGIETPCCPGARCTLSYDRGTWVLERTPGAVTVSTSTTPLRLNCQAGDRPATTMDSGAAAAPATGAGAVVSGAVGGGAVGLGFGAAALSFTPVLGVIAVVSGIGMGPQQARSPRHKARRCAIPTRCPCRWPALPHCRRHRPSASRCAHSTPRPQRRPA